MMAFAKVYETADAAALAELFLDESMIVDPDGNATRGKAAVAAMYEAAFKENPGLKLESSVQDIRFLTPDLVRVEGKGAAFEHAWRRSGIHWLHHAAWLAATENGESPRSTSMRRPPKRSRPYERLKELEWMVGEWVDESDNAKVAVERCAGPITRVIWSGPTRSQLEGEKPSTGTMFIGWDPQSGQIKSWLFNSEGGHGEGLWTRTERKGVGGQGDGRSARRPTDFRNSDSDV